MKTSATFMRPVSGTLIVRLSNGDELNATPEDLEKFGYIDVSKTYGIIADMLRDAAVLAGADFKGSLATAVLGDIRYLIECALHGNPDHISDERKRRIGEATAGWRHYDYETANLVLDLGPDYVLDEDQVARAAFLENVFAPLLKDLIDKGEIGGYRWSRPRPDEGDE